MSSKVLFSKTDIFSVLEHQKEAVKKEVYALESNYLLNASDSDLIQWLIDKLKLDVPEILDSEIYVAEHGETKVDISRHPNRYFIDRSQPYYVTGTKTVIAIPFSGEAVFLEIRSSIFFSSGYPRAIIVNNEIQLINPSC